MQQIWFCAAGPDCYRDARPGHVLHEALALQKLTEGSVSAWVCEPEGTMALYELFFVLSLISDSSHRFRLRVE